MKVKGVVFDFDGPVCDSFREGLRRIEVLARTNDIPFDRTMRKRLIDLWGLAGVELLQRGLGIHPELAKILYTKWEVWDVVDPPQLIPGAQECLVWNDRQGIANCLLTSRNLTSLQGFFHKYSLDRDFSFIQTREQCVARKPDPKVLKPCLQFLRKRGIKKSEVIFVGDTPEDIKTANAAGVEVVVVMTGSYWADQFLNFPVKQQNIIASVDYLPEWVERYAV